MLTDLRYCMHITSFLSFFFLVFHLYFLTPFSFFRFLPSFFFHFEVPDLKISFLFFPLPKVKTFTILDTVSVSTSTFNIFCFYCTLTPSIVSCHFLLYPNTSNFILTLPILSWHLVLYRVSQKTWEFSDEFDIVFVMN